MATSAELHASAGFIKTVCKEQNMSFLMCKKMDEHPGACLEQGRSVKTCVDNLIRHLETTCSEPFADFKKCLKKSNNDFGECARQKKALREAFEAVGDK